MARWPHVTGFALILNLWAVVSVAWGQAPAVWVFDEVTLMNGSQFLGVILKESSTELEFQVVIRRAGRPTLTLTSTYTTREIDTVKRLSAADRAALKAKLAELDPSGIGERKRMESLELTPTTWLGKPNGAQLYSSDRFVLVSGASEEVTRRAAVRLEQIYAAFTRFLPPQNTVAQPTTVFLAGQLDDYRKLIGPTAGVILNPAIYEPAMNRIVCGNDLRRLGAELNTTHKKHAQELAKIDKYEKEIRQLYRNPELERFMVVVSRERERLRKADRANDEVFDKATKGLFALLYHEAFHSYVATYVYPPKSAEEVRAGKGTGELPRWLNEGYAQIFETAVIEAGELRVGHADTNTGRLDRVQKLLKAKPGLLPIPELLRAGRDSFLAAHADQQSATNRVYLTSWAVTFYLASDRQLIGTKDFRTYLTTINTGGDPVQAFQNWVGQDVVAFEKDLADYLARLLPDGTLTPRRP